VIWFTRLSSGSDHGGVTEGVSLLELRLLGRREHVLDRGSAPLSDLDLETTLFARFPEHGCLR
jgi:hypothetical protein